MDLEIGSILEGKVSTLAKFGAFVSLPGNRSGLVHISEIANTYVEDVSAHLQQGQSVRVKVLSVSAEGKVSLSIKKALPEQVAFPVGPIRLARSRPVPRPSSRMSEPVAPQTPEAVFEDKLKQFMSASDSKMSDLNRNKDGRGRRRRK